MPTLMFEVRDWPDPRLVSQAFAARLTVQVFGAVLHHRTHTDDYATLFSRPERQIDEAASALIRYCLENRTMGTVNADLEKACEDSYDWSDSTMGEANLVTCVVADWENCVA